MTATFSDLPIDVLEKIVKESDLQECLVLRKVSRDLRTLVDSSEIHCEKIEFTFGYSLWTVNFNNVMLKYEDNKDGGCTVTVCKIGTEVNTKSYWDDQDFKQGMIADASTFLENPKLKIDRVEVENLTEDDVVQFLDYLKSLKHQLNVRSFYNPWGDCVAPFLPFMKPDELEDITLRLTIITALKEI